MQGPTAAISSQFLFFFSKILTVLSIIPFKAPFQPACMQATKLFFLSIINMGTQSAVKTAKATPF